MKAYRKTVRIRMLLLAALVLFAVALSVYDGFFATAEVRENNVFSFQCGVADALGVAAAAVMVQYGKALRSEKALRRLYVKEHDERMKAIRAKAGMPLNLFFAVGMIAAGIVMGYFNAVVFVTLVIAGAAQLLVAAAVKLVYQRIY